MRFIVAVVNSLDDIDLNGYTEDALKEARELEEHFVITSHERPVAGDCLQFYGQDGNTLYTFEVVEVLLSGSLDRRGYSLELRLYEDHEVRVKWVSIN